MPRINDTHPAPPHVGFTRYAPAKKHVGFTRYAPAKKHVGFIRYAPAKKHVGFTRYAAAKAERGVSDQRIFRCGAGSGGRNAGVGDAALKPRQVQAASSSGAAALHQPLTAGNPAALSEGCRVSAWAEKRWRVEPKGSRRTATTGEDAEQTLKTPRAGRFSVGRTCGSLASFESERCVQAKNGNDKPRCREASRPVGPSRTLNCVPRALDFLKRARRKFLNPSFARGGSPGERKRRRAGWGEMFSAFAPHPARTFSVLATLPRKRGRDKASNEGLPGADINNTGDSACRVYPICATNKACRVYPICATNKACRVYPICATNKACRVYPICATNKACRGYPICAD